MRLQLLLLATAACFAAVCTQTFRNIIDTSQPIVRRAPGMLNPDAYFGYSMVLHKIRTDETDMASALSNTRSVSLFNLTLGLIEYCLDSLFILWR